MHSNMNQRSARNLFKSAFRLFTSFGLATFLILAIAFLSILGTILPPCCPTEHMTTAQSPWSLRSIISFLRLDDMFHSPWFLVLGFLLFLNIVMCTGKKLHGIIFRRRQSSPGRQSPVMLRSLTHVGIAVILVGFTLGGYAGFESYVEIPEGESVRIASFLPDHERVDQGLAVRCDDFTIEYYASGMPKEFRSDLTFERDGEIINQGPLLVNHPISIDDIRYYQAHYRVDPLAVITVDYEGQTSSFTAAPGQNIPLGHGASLYVSRIEENFMNMGPAAKIEFSSPRENGSLWLFYGIEEILDAVPDLFSRAPQFNPSKFSGYVFSLAELKPLYATGLMVSYDPGIPIVVLGSVLLLLGLFFTYLAPSSAARFRMKKDPSGEKATT
ncbi:MAG: cytochrome c biogenesis protein ResB [Desulfomonilia bacterium]